MTSISKATATATTTTTEPASSPSFHPAAAVAATGVGGAGTLHRQRSTEDDRVALITNLPPGTTELTLRHFLHGTMARKGMKAGAEPPIAKVRLLTPSDEEKVEQTRISEADEEGSKASTLNIKPDDTPPPTTTAALVEFATSEDCQMAILMLEEESGNNNNTASARNGVSRDTIAANTAAAVPVTLQGHRLHIEKLTDTYHVNHADRNESIRNSVNKRNGMAKYGTDYSKLDKSHLSQEVNRLEEALSLERVALHQTRDELLNEQGRQVENDELLFSAAAAVMNRTKEALAVERAKRSSLEEQVGRLEKLLFQAEKEIQRLRGGGGSGISPAVEEEAYRSSPVALPEEEMDDVDDDTPPPPLEKIQPNRLESFFLSAEAAGQ